MPLGAIVGGIVGSFIFKVKSKSEDKRLIDNAIKVLNGEKENKINLDGKNIDVKRFIVKNDDDKEVTLTFGDGEIREEEIKRVKKDIIKKDMSLEIDEKALKKEARKLNKETKRNNKDARRK